MRNKDHPVFSSITDISKSKVQELASEAHDKVFEKTDCLSCGNCCKSAPPIVTNHDIKRIAKFLGVSPKSIRRKHVIQDHDGEMSFNYVPCTFLGDDNYCSIYEARPEACRDYPHTKSGNFKARKQLHLTNQEICPAVDNILNYMEDKIAQDKG